LSIDSIYALKAFINFIQEASDKTVTT